MKKWLKRIALAFVAGILSFATPCVLPLVPGYLAALTGTVPGEGGPDEAASFIAETVNDLAWLAGRHKLDLLCYLLSMTQMEAEELVRSRSKKKPS